jgi:hypothetical protein
MIQVWGTIRAQVEGVMNIIEEILAQAGNWEQIELGGDKSNPSYIISMLLTSWYCGQEEEKRTAQSSLLYRGDMNYDIRIHGAVSTA